MIDYAFDGGSSRNLSSMPDSLPQHLMSASKHSIYVRIRRTFEKPKRTFFPIYNRLGTNHTPCSACISVARLEEPIGQRLLRTAMRCYRGRARTNLTPPSAAHTNGHLNHRDELQEEAILRAAIAIGSQE